MKPPAILVSYVNLRKFLREREDKGEFRDWVLDSGAYSVLTSNAEISLSEYIDSASALLASDPALRTVFSLDVIGDPEKSLRNHEEMRRQGVPAVPTFHYGTSWGFLKAFDAFPKMAVGGLVARGKGGHGTALQPAERLRFLEQCFARVWPKWVHGFGCCDKRFLFRLPFASVDSTSWYYAAARYGALQFGRPGTAARDGQKNRLVPSKAKSPTGFDSAISVQVDWHSDLEDVVRNRMGKVLAALGTEFDLRLVVSGPELEYIR